MIGYLFAIVAAAFTADTIVKHATGEHIHDHLYGCFRAVTDSVRDWLVRNSHLGISEVAVVWLDQIDGAAARIKHAADKIILRLIGLDAAENEHHIATVEVSASEALAEFPQLRNHPILRMQV